MVLRILNSNLFYISMSNFVNRGVQNLDLGGAALDCIKIRGKTDVLCVKMIQRELLLCDANPQFTRAFRDFLFWELFVF